MTQHPIEDANDERLTGYRNLAEPPEGLFVVETERVLRRALADARDQIESVLLSHSHAKRLESELTGLTTYIADKSVMSEVAGFQIHRGVLALVRRPPKRTVADLAEATTLVIADQISDPSNLGALFRNAAAFNVGGMILGPGCADPFYRKCVRVSIGHVLTVPFAQLTTWSDLDALPHDLWAAELEENAVPAHDWQPENNIALVLGAEGTGVSPAVRDRCQAAVQIPRAKHADSLNVATAAAVLLYERTRTSTV